MFSFFLVNTINMNFLAVVSWFRLYRVKHVKRLYLRFPIITVKYLRSDF